GRGLDPIRVPALPEVRAEDPTGVGDGFRAGFFAGISWGLGLERAAQVGCLLAAQVLETVGTQEYVVDPGSFLKRFAEVYGDVAAAEVRPHLVGCATPAAAGRVDDGPPPAGAMVTPAGGGRSVGQRSSRR